MKTDVKYFKYWMGSGTWVYFKVPDSLEGIEMIWFSGQVREVRLVELEEFLARKRNGRLGGEIDAKDYSEALYDASPASDRTLYTDLL